MPVLVAGLVLFFGVHSVSIASPAWRDGVVARIGVGRWRGLYSLVALLGFVLVIWGYGVARREPVILYVPPAWLRDVTLLLMLPVFPLFFASHLPGRIQAAAKHPMLLATQLWAVAHLLANGTLADALLFGGFLVWASLDRVSAERRGQRPSHMAPPSPRNDVIAVAIGLAVYLLLVLGGHRWLIGLPASRWTLF
ncbi:MAG TPA: NnrU family protein [Gammaproteobacteria bacterium]